MGRITFAERLHDILRERDIMQVELCKMTGIGKSAMSQYLSGAFTPRQETLYKLASALDVSEAWLMGYDVPCDRKIPTGRESDSDSFYFTAADDSMASFCIPNGSKVLIQKNDYAHSGQIVCFSIADAQEMLLRKLYKQGTGFVFTASSSGDYPPFIFSESDFSARRLKIHGVAIKVIISL
ncbi:LexA family protein [Zhenpiania hominis]|uniref:Helix-turn-helix domain-containing protein n=1 Tax=Zhenpiania hominis TaxID=2763644 RepID=A0A923NK69_9FIRM|nr:S24 family peptidase [Zhenpiania hominis]MBC6679582.1 helix-turn-helix domain-containing protein [Zhenpiania hominis]